MSRVEAGPTLVRKEPSSRGVRHVRVTPDAKRFSVSTGKARSSSWSTLVASIMAVISIFIAIIGLVPDFRAAPSGEPVPPAPSGGPVQFDFGASLPILVAGLTIGFALVMALSTVRYLRKAADQRRRFHIDDIQDYELRHLITKLVSGNLTNTRELSEQFNSWQRSR